jgi:hypothetical protein
MRRLSSVFGWKRGTRTIRWLRMALSLLQLLSSCCLVMMLLWTADKTSRLLTWSGGRTLDALESLFQKLDLNLEVVDFVCFVGNISNLVGQHFNIGRIITSWIQWLVDCDTSSDNVFAEVVNGHDYLADFVLHTKDGVTNSLDGLFVGLEHAVVEGDLLLEANDGMAHVGIARRANSLRMLARGCTH